MEIRLLGELEAVDDAGERVDVRGTKQRTLLAALAVSRGEPVSIDRLVDVVWGDDVPGNPANAVQAQVSQLRRMLGAQTIVTRQGGYALVAELDTERLERLVNDGRDRLASGDVDGAATMLRDAIIMCTSDPLAEFAFADFAAGERARLHELRLLALEAYAEAELALGHHRELTGRLEALCAEHPLRERLWALLMTAHYRSGRQADALRAYGEARRVLVEDLGIEPGPELRRLEAMVLAQDPALELAHRPATASGEPAGSRPPAPDLTSAGNLRPTLTRFVGRDDDLVRVCALVESARLVTLVGPGGVGKTRLALEAAEAAREQFPHGTWLVELAGVLDPAGVAPAIATALGIAEVPPGPGTAGAPTAVDAIVTHLTGRTLLVVLDNCEHLISEAASVADRLLADVPGLRVVATSREALAVPGESLLPVGPLPPADAVTLFVDRARTASPGFELTAEQQQLAEDVCRRLDGLPLAIELAAARLRALPLRQLAARLDDRFRILTGGARTALPRHQTLRAVVDWSYDLLFSDEQRLFRRLAAFPGGFALPAAEAVCADATLPEEDVMETVLRLVDKSLLAPYGDGEGDDLRFAHLQTLWQYARERLAETDEADTVRARHAAYFRQMGVDAREGLRGATGPAWRKRLTVDIDNLRAALDWHIAAGDADAAASMVSGLAWLWFLNGDFYEGTRWLADALAVEGEARPEVRALTHAWHGYFSGTISNPAVAVVECEDAVKALTGEADRVLRAEVMLLLASTLMRVRGFEQSLAVMREARDLLEQEDYQWGLAAADLLTAIDLASLGRLDEAQSMARASIERFDALGEVWFTVEPLGTLAGVAEAQGDLDGAAASYERILHRCRAAHQPSYEPLWLVRLAGVRARQGDEKAAGALYDEAIACSRSPAVTAEACRGRAAVARRLGDLPRAHELLDEAAALYEMLDVATGRTSVLAERAWCAIAAGRVEDAATLAVNAAHEAAASGDPTASLVAETIGAVIDVLADPSPAHLDAFLGVAARRRERTAAFGGLTDDPDVTALAERLAGATG